MAQTRSLKVLVLSDSLRGGAPLRHGVAQLPGVQAAVLVTNERGEPPWRFRMRQALQCVRSLIKRPYITVSALAGTRITSHRLHDTTTLEWLHQARFDIGIHDLAVIYRSSSLEAFRLGMLNAHIGILPRYRGRSVMEWSLLHEDPTGVTVFFVDEGVDTGPRIVLRREVPVWGPGIPEAKAKLWQVARSMYGEAIERILADEALQAVQPPHEGTRFYVMSDLFLEVVSELLPATPPPPRSRT
jgi:folate-dependent phosphoribosylglycinamide formyltransferase PurN